VARSQLGVQYATQFAFGFTHRSFEPVFERQSESLAHV
jgi:hypothetical protein